MLDVLSFQGAGIGVLSVVGVFTAFHILVIAGVVPSGIVWGGRITQRSQLIKMELVSVLVLGITAAIVALHLYTGRGQAPSLGTTIGMWILTALFTLNTVGNVFAKSAFERFAFTPITAALALLSFRLAVEWGFHHG